MTTPNTKPTTSASQLRTIALCEAVHSRKPSDYRLHEVQLPIDEEPETVRRKVAATRLGDLLLPQGASFSIGPPGHMYDMNMYVGSTTLTAVTLGARLVKAPDYIKVNNELVKQGTLSYYRLIFNFLHVQPETGQTATEKVMVLTEAPGPVQTPTMRGDVYAQAYADIGYNGHNERSIEPIEAEALTVVELFEATMPEEIRTLARAAIAKNFSDNL